MAKLKSYGTFQAGPVVKKTIEVISALSQAGRLVEAEAKAQELYKQFPDRADVNDALSLTLVDQRKFVLALAFAEAAVKSEPKNPAYLVNLGQLYLDLGVIENALPILERAEACKPSPFEAPWAIAEFFHDSGKAERSIEYFKKALVGADEKSALQIQQDYLRSLISLGRVDEAEKLAAILANHPEYKVSAVIRAASLKKHKVDSPMFEQLQSLRNSEKLEPEAKAGIILEIGRIFENSKNYDEAFRCFAESKVGLKYTGSTEDFTKLVNVLIQAFPADTFSKFAEFGSQSDQPVFVVGMPRSGTTLTERIIAAHPEAAGVGELHRMRNLFSRLTSKEGTQSLDEALRCLGPDQWEDVSKNYLRLINYLSPNKRRIVDKMPHNFVIVGFIALCFPHARFVHCFRNPIDNFVSAFQNRMSSAHGYSFDQVSYAKYYLQYSRLMAHWKSVLPGRIFDLSYEELAQNPEPTARKLIGFLGLEWSDECLRFHEKEATVRTFSKYQVRNAINANSVARWKNYEKYLGPIIEILGARA